MLAYTASASQLAGLSAAPVEIRRRHRGKGLSKKFEKGAGCEAAKEKLKEKLKEKSKKKPKKKR